MPDLPLVSKPRAVMKGVPTGDEAGQGRPQAPTIGFNENPLLKAIGNAKTIKGPWDFIIPPGKIEE